MTQPQAWSAHAGAEAADLWFAELHSSLRAYVSIHVVPAKMV